VLRELADPGDEATLRDLAVKSVPDEVLRELRDDAGGPDL